MLYILYFLLPNKFKFYKRPFTEWILFFLSITEYSIDYDRDYLEEMVKKSRDPQDKVYAEMLLQKKSIKEACQNPFSTGGWSRRNSVATRRISNVSEISLSFIYGKQLSITDIEECEP